MHEITKTIIIPVDGSPKDFRLTKLDAFSGAFLLRLFVRLPNQFFRPLDLLTVF